MARKLSFATVANSDGVDNLDGPIADPEHHRVVFENEHVPGDGDHHWCRR